MVIQNSYILQNLITKEREKFENNFANLERKGY